MSFSSKHIKILKHCYIMKEKPSYEELENKISVLEKKIEDCRSVEESFIALQQKLSLQIEHTPLAVIEWNMDLEVTEWNPGAARIFGFTREEAMGRHAKELIISDKEVDKIDKVWKGLLEQKGGQRSNNKNITKSGEIVFCEWYNTPITNHLGQVTGVISLAQDITVQIQAEADKGNANAYLESSLESAPDGVLLLDDQLRFIYANPAFFNIFGHNTKRLFGKTLSEIPSAILDPETKKILIHRATNRLHNGESITGIEFEVTRDDGNKVPISYSAAAIKDKEENILGLVVFLKDITFRKKNQEMMMQADKIMSVGGLAAGMAHEINNPLGAILQGTQNIIRRFSPELQRNHQLAKEFDIDLNKLHMYMEKRNILTFIDGIRESGARAARIINNMLQFTRRSESHMAPTDISALLNKTVEIAGNDYDLKKRFDFRDISIVKELESDLPLVPCTETEIEQVILNLLKNAAQAMDDHAAQRSPRIVLRCYTNEAGVTIEVEDNGPGMDESIRKRVFEPFFTTKPVGSGTGLGLSVSYMIITENHKGTLEVEAEKGQGTKFIIKLPLNREPFVKIMHEPDLNRFPGSDRIGTTL